MFYFQSPFKNTIETHKHHIPYKYYQNHSVQTGKGNLSENGNNSHKASNVGKEMHIKANK